MRRKLCLDLMEIIYCGHKGACDGVADSEAHKCLATVHSLFAPSERETSVE